MNGAPLLPSRLTDETGGDGTVTLKHEPRPATTSLATVEINMRARDRSIQRRGRALTTLVVRRLPQDFEITGSADAWPAVGVALLSRMTTTLGSILDLQSAGLEVDAATLSRSLYEHSVHFAWLAAEPTPTRLEEWRKNDLDARLKADADMRRHGVKTITDQRRAELQAEVAQLVGNTLHLEQLAFDADKHWASRIPGFVGGTVWSFGGLYALLYRHYSATAHPSMRGLNRVTDDISATVRHIRLERTYEGNGPYGMATVLFGVALYVAAARLGWPASDEINRVFARDPA